MKPLLKRAGAFLLENNRNASLVAFLFSLLPLIGLPGGFIAGVILGLVTLRRGWRAGLIVLLWVALPGLALSVLYHWGPYDILLARFALMWLFAGLLYQYESWTLLLEAAALLGALAVIVLHLVVDNPATWWSLWLHRSYGLFSGQMGLQLPPEMDIKQVVAVASKYASGLVALLILLGTTVQLLLARWWQAKLFKPGGLRREFFHIRINRPAACILLLVAIGWQMQQPLCMDLMPVLFLPFLLAGLSLLHCLSARWRVYRFFLVGLYVLSFFLPVLVVLLWVLVGFGDSWLDFRKRIKVR